MNRTLKSYIAFTTMGALVGLILGLIVVLFTNPGDWAAFWCIVGLFTGTLLVLRVLAGIGLALFAWAIK